MPENSPYPSIADYGFIAGSNSAALVSREGSIDWCCIQRIDAGSCFGRLLDWEKGGYCSISPRNGVEASSREYVENTLVLRTIFRAGGGEAHLYDCYSMPRSTEEFPYRQLIRIVEGIRGHVGLELDIRPRFDYGEVEPWIRQEGVKLYSAIGGDDGLLISTDTEITSDDQGLTAQISVHAGERARLSMISVPPEQLDQGKAGEIPGVEKLDERLEETIEWWRGWSSRNNFTGPHSPGVILSATAIKGLMNDVTGGIAAAATTSLPEIPGGEANWDYRYAWIRDSFFSVRSLAEIGFEAEANRFRRFLERSAAGSARKLQIMYGVGGERRLTEENLDFLEGYRGASPVRVGNAAVSQLQLDIYGELLELSWRWHERGNSPDDDYWRFIVDLVDAAAELWNEPDHGIWEQRGEPQHYVLTKVMCWAAFDRGLRLAEECMRKAPEQRWKKARKEAYETIMENGYDEDRGVFTQTFQNQQLDAALLLLPRLEFLDYTDERMLRTTDAIWEELNDDGLLKRYGNAGQEGAFLACSFWLAECLAHQGRIDEAQSVFDRSLSTSNDLGLFSEMYDAENGEMLGNFPQALTHLSHITAAVAIAEHRGPVSEPGQTA